MGYDRADATETAASLLLDERDPKKVRAAAAQPHAERPRRER
jgi:hypothetical protein